MVDDKLAFETRFSKATRQYRHIFLAMEKVKYYVRGLKSSISEEMLEELRRISPNLRSSLIENRCIAAAIGRSQRALVDHAQSLQSMNTKTRKKGLPRLCSVPPRMNHLLDLFYLRNKILILICIELSESIPTADDVNQSLQ